MRLAVIVYQAVLPDGKPSCTVDILIETMKEL